MKENNYSFIQYLNRIFYIENLIHQVFYILYSKPILLFFFLFQTLTFQSNSQNYSNTRSRIFTITNDTLKIDTLNIIPSSVIIYDEKNNIIHDSLYTIDFQNSSLVFKTDREKRPAQILVTYQTLPYDMSQKYFHKDYNKIILGPELEKPVVFYQEKSFNPFANERIESSGSISRGISFGNNQDVVVNSGLNLQLTGKLDNNLNIVAAITDENIPIQPDGYTQQIQEFDKVYINIFNDKINTIAGDFELIHNQGYLLRANKKGQGGIATINTKIKEKENAKYITTFSGALAKGRFTRNQLNAIEGNQGPYRLYGEKNEMYIIILAGTEKVYIDGKLLNRGENNDYVINYNSAEISFTTNQPITKDKRIVVEFEYSDRNYARFMLYNHHQVETNNGRIWINIYNEQDAKNQPLLQDLSNEKKRILSLAGENPSMAIVPNFDSVGFNNEQIRYKMIYNTVTNDSIFIYSTNPDSAVYKVGFSYVGENNGNYIQEISAANGRVFTYVSPANGLKQGAYEPVTLLIAPQKKQMITLGYDYKLFNTVNSYLEIGVSNNDLNTFSTLNNDDNIGYAIKTGLSKTFFLSDSGKTGLFTGINYEFSDFNFRPVERYKPVEYERDWNLIYNLPFEKEHLIDFKTTYFKSDLGKIAYYTENLRRGYHYNAFKNGGSVTFNKSGFKILGDLSYLNSMDTINNTSFLRYNGDVSKSISMFIIGLREETELNKWHNVNTDSLTINSYRFDQYNGYIGIGDSSKHYTEISYGSRLDRLPLNNYLKNSTQSRDANIKYRFFKPFTTLLVQLNYRKLFILDTTLSENSETETISGRMENSINLFKKLITTSTFYEVGTGMEPVKEYTYTQVLPGEGIYTWNDYNGNNVQELDEFETANYSDEANYIRVFIPTRQYEKVYYNQFNQTINIDFYNTWNKSIGVKKVLSRFSNLASYNVSQKNKDITLTENLNPFIYSYSSVIPANLTIYIRNSLGFNKRSNIFWLEYFYLKSKNNLLLVNGLDKKSKYENKLLIFYRIIKGLYINGYINYSIKDFESEFLKSKNYTIHNQSNNNELTYEISAKSRLIVTYLYTNKSNISGNEKLTGHTAGAELRTSHEKTGTISTKINFIKLNFNSSENSSISYEMLEGLKPGNNLTWLIMLRKTLISGLELQINYEGRFSENVKVIHIGGVQLRAIF